MNGGLVTFFLFEMLGGRIVNFYLPLIARLLEIN